MKQIISRNFKIIIGVIILIFSINFNIIAQEQTVGLFINDSASFEGYTLFAPRSSTTTYLIDNNGLLVHTWESDYLPGQAAYLLESGNLVRSSLIPTEDGSGGFQELAWDGTVVWEYGYGKQHHDIEVLPNGNVLLVASEVKNNAACIESGRNPDLLDNRLRVLHILEIAKTESGGEVVWEWHNWDHLIQDFDQTKLNYGVVEDHPELIDINFATSAAADWIHTNSIDYNPEFDQIIVSNRGINEIWVIDHSTTTEEAASHSGGNSGKGGDLLYRWGNQASYRTGSVEDQELFAQHDAYWVEPGLPGEGNIVVFNNGLGRPEGAFSSIDEIIPPVDQAGNYFLEPDSAYEPSSQIWTYIADNPTDFFAPRFSGSQRLLNGNTLICSGVEGIFFEVTPENEIVWKYINPVNDGVPVAQGDSVSENSVGKCYRYAPDYSGLVGQDLTPGGPIELPPTSIRTNKKNILKEFELYNNYPNPFNPVTYISYRLSVGINVQLDVFNSLGQKIKTLVSEEQSSGNYKVEWDGTNQLGKTVSSGVYIYQLRSDDFVKTKKMLYLK